MQPITEEFKQNLNRVKELLWMVDLTTATEEGLGLALKRRKKDIEVLVNYFEKVDSKKIKKDLKTFGEKTSGRTSKKVGYEQLENHRKMTKQNLSQDLGNSIRNLISGEIALFHAKIECRSEKDIAVLEFSVFEAQQILYDQLNILDMRVHDGQAGGSPHHRMKCER